MSINSDQRGSPGPQESIDAYEQRARRAGAALRRPAPHDGIAALRSARRRQQLVHGALAGCAAIAVIAVAVVVLSGRDPDRGLVPATVPNPTLPTPSTEPTPTIERWAVVSPGSIDMQPHAGSPPALMLVTGDESTVTVRNPWQWDVTTRIRPTDENGTPVAIDSLRSTLFLTIAISTDGQIVQVDPWHGGSTPWRHPGEVTDVFPVFPPGSGGPWPVAFWATGFDQIDGRRTPVVWYDTGPVSDNQGTVTGVPTATMIASGEPGGTGWPLITGDTNVAYALLPEPDGTSQLWIVQQGGPSSRATGLSFREPTATVIGGDQALWVADENGLHVVDVGASTMVARTVSDTPIRSLWPNYNDQDHAVLILDDNGAVASVAGSGEAVEHYRDDAATAMLAYPFGPDDHPQLFLVHGHADEVAIVDLDVFSNPEGAGWSWN